MAMWRLNTYSEDPGKRVYSHSLTTVFTILNTYSDNTLKARFTAIQILLFPIYKKSAADNYENITEINCNLSI